MCKERTAVCPWGHTPYHLCPVEGHKVDSVLLGQPNENRENLDSRPLRVFAVIALEPPRTSCPCRQELTESPQTVLQDHQVWAP